MNAFHAEGNVAVARAARAKNTLQVMSSGTMQSVEEVTRARGGPIWFQLYTNGDWKATDATLKRVAAAGCPVVVWTIDNVADAHIIPRERGRPMPTAVAPTSRARSRCRASASPTVIELLRRELQIIMAESGASSIAAIGRASLVTRS